MMESLFFYETGKAPRVEVRKMNENGQVVVGNATGSEYTTGSRPEYSSPGSRSGYSTDWVDEGVSEDTEDFSEGEFLEGRKAGNSWDRSEVPILLYLYQVPFYTL
jgi:hypothetical protein